MFLNETSSGACIAVLPDHSELTHIR